MGSSSSARWYFAALTARELPRKRGIGARAPRRQPPEASPPPPPDTKALPMKRCISAALVCLPLALAASAQADSISFIRSGDIWVAASDGTQQVQLTKDGGYS